MLYTSHILAAALPYVTVVGACNIKQRHVLVIGVVPGTYEMYQCVYSGLVY